MSDWNLEPGDMSIHFGAALGSVLLLGWLGSLVHPLISILPALICLAVFYLREALQQGKKATPPKNKWNIFQWGPRGIAEFVVVIPAVIAAVVIITLIG